MMSLKTLADVRRTCIHELGHLAVSVAIGVAASRIEVEMTSDRAGAFWYTTESTRLLRSGKIAGSVCQIALGGLLAELILDRGSSINPSCFDWSSDIPDIRDAREAAESLTTTVADRDDLLARSAASAFGYVLRSWDAIQAAAAWMLANDLVLSGPQIQRFFGKH